MVDINLVLMEGKYLFLIRFSFLVQTAFILGYILCSHFFEDYIENMNKVFFPNLMFWIKAVCTKKLKPPALCPSLVKIGSG
jgi:hypothetical protein